MLLHGDAVEAQQGTETFWQSLQIQRCVAQEVLRGKIAAAQKSCDPHQTEGNGEANARPVRPGRPRRPGRGGALRLRHRVPRAIHARLDQAEARRQAAEARKLPFFGGQKSLQERHGSKVTSWRKLAQSEQTVPMSCIASFRMGHSEKAALNANEDFTAPAMTVLFRESISQGFYVDGLLLAVEAPDPTEQPQRARRTLGVSWGAS